MKINIHKDNRGYTLDAEARTKEKQAEIYDYRQAHAKKRLPFWGGAVRLDDCLYDENGNEKAPPYFPITAKVPMRYAAAENPRSNGMMPGFRSSAALFRP